jgi:hypothetical protein
LRQSYDRIEHGSDLIRPIVAAEDVTADKTGGSRQLDDIECGNAYCHSWPREQTF